MHPAAPIDSPPGSHRPRKPRAPLVAALLSVLSLVLILLVELEWGPLGTVDGDIARTTHRWAVAHDGLTHASRILSDWVWDPWTMRALITVAVVWLVFRGERRLALWLAVTCAVGTLLQQGLKAAVDKPRPVWPDPVDSAHFAAFPSGHAMTATVVCGLLLWLLRVYGVGPAVWRTGVTIAVVSVIGVGATRIWNGVHWPSDVVGGWLLGALMVALAVATYTYRPSTRPPETT
ncbi:phosphatase PAP2 family protein [Streptomyces sp. NBC_01283]|uniref:phosphatase PAP2 family protein n=1 Tax=Streptomyces sp. NBC_01283 TaxID=2903812 RepID=UPI00352DF240|nr:phosphatase PAP2 family protein [Streptomyces sp. NBC_01283]